MATTPIGITSGAGVDALIQSAELNYHVSKEISQQWRKEDVKAATTSLVIGWLMCLFFEVAFGARDVGTIFPIHFPRVLSQFQLQYAQRH